MEEFNLIMAIVLSVLNALLFIVETFYYVVKTVKELSLCTHFTSLSHIMGMWKANI